MRDSVREAKARTERNVLFDRECCPRSSAVSPPQPICQSPIKIKALPRDIKAPIILQVSQGGSAYFAGKGLANDKQQASIAGSIAAALHIRTVAKAYGV